MMNQRGWELVWNSGYAFHLTFFDSARALVDNVHWNCIGFNANTLIRFATSMSIQLWFAVANTSCFVNNTISISLRIFSNFNVFYVFSCCCFFFSTRRKSGSFYLVLLVAASCHVIHTNFLISILIKRSFIVFGRTQSVVNWKVNAMRYFVRKFSYGWKCTRI